MEKKKVALLVIVLIVFAQAVSAKIIYVDSSASGADDGTSWINAYVYLQDAISEAIANDEIRVAAGVYCPDQGDGYTPGDREASFVLKNLVRIIGGFPAGGGSVEERDWETNKTILSGDLNGDDNPETLVEEMLTDVTRVENSYHIVFSNLCGPPTLLDGLVITGGQADGEETLGYGGGSFNVANSSPTIANCTFTANAAKNWGAAVWIESVASKPQISDCKFYFNYAGDGGAAICCLLSGFDVIIENCDFTDNYAVTSGGAIFNSTASPTITSCAFSNCYATNGGAIRNYNNSNPILNDLTLESNTAKYGGAIYSDNSSSQLNSCSFKSNSATSTGGACYYLNGSGTNLTDCVFNANTANGSGGACYFNGGQASFNNCDFNDNHGKSGTVCNTSCNVNFDNCDFIENRTEVGGAIYTRDSLAEINYCLFYGNSSTIAAGAIYNYAGRCDLVSSRFIYNQSNSHGGAIFNQAYSTGYGHTYLTGWNCLFIGNYSEDTNANGGAIANLYYTWKKSTHPYTRYYRYNYNSLVNCTLYGNTTVNVGGGIYSDNSSSTNSLQNCIIYGNMDTGGSQVDESAQLHGGTNTVQYSCIQGLTSYAGNGNVGDDPLFVNPLGEDWIPGTMDDNLSLASGSPCIDAGNGLLVPDTLLTDLDGFARCQDDPATVDTGIFAKNPPHDPNGVVDMGAYEVQPCIPFCSEELKAAVEEALGVTCPTEADMLNLVFLDISEMDIDCLGGLEYAENLVELKAQRNQIQDLSPLSGLTQLKTLYLYSNEIEDISPLCNLNNLTYLHLAYNDIAEIPGCICNMTNLQNLFLYNNSITDLCPLVCLENQLVKLWIYGNDPLTLETYTTCIPQIIENNPGVDLKFDPGCEKILAGDINEDCFVNLLDFALMVSNWLECNHMYQEMCTP